MNGLKLHPPKRTEDKKDALGKHVMKHLGVMFNATATMEESIAKCTARARSNMKDIALFDLWRSTDGHEHETSTRTKRTIFHQQVQSQLQHIEAIAAANKDDKTKRMLALIRGNSLKKIAGVAAEASERDAALLEGEFTTKNHMRNELAQATLRVLSDGKCNQELKRALHHKGKRAKHRTKQKWRSPIDEGMCILNETIVGPILQNGNVLTPQEQRLPTWNRKHIEFPEWERFGKLGTHEDR